MVLFSVKPLRASYIIYFQVDGLCMGNSLCKWGITQWSSVTRCRHPTGTLLSFLTPAPNITYLVLLIHCMLLGIMMACNLEPP